MAESKSESGPSQPSRRPSLIEILDLFDSAGCDDAYRSDYTDSDSLLASFSWSIAICSHDSYPIIETVEEVEHALKLIGCPHALQANQIEDLDCVAIYPAAQWLVSQVKAKQHKSEHVKRRKAVVLNELQLLREKINENGIDSTVQKLASLLKTSKALERQGSNFMSQCNSERLKLISEITGLEEKQLNGSDDEDLCDHLDHLICDLSAALKNAKRELASKLRDYVSLKRQLDDVPIAEEVAQYEQRFSELNVHIQDRLQRTRKYYATYNALLEIKDLMLKEISLLNSLDSQFQDAIGNPAGRTKLIDSMEAILRGTQQKLEKVDPGLEVERKAFDALREEYTAAIANQRRSAVSLKAIQEELKRNQQLKEEHAKSERVQEVQSDI